MDSTLPLIAFFIMQNMANPVWSATVTNRGIKCSYFKVRCTDVDSWTVLLQIK